MSYPLSEKKPNIPIINRIYYLVRPLIPRFVQIALRRHIAKRKRLKYSNIWPISETSKSLPIKWTGWPDNKKFALVLTHDVETERGHQKCINLMNLEKRLGFRSSFNFVPERYHVSEKLRNCLLENGFEVGVHGLIHDGKLYKSKKIFKERVVKINRYLKEWNAVGFRSPAMHYNLKWIRRLNIEYDASTFDVDPFEPQFHGMNTIFPFYVNGSSKFKGYVELPYTMPQDFTIFVLLQEKDISLWQRKLDWIAEKGGMVLLNVHPDYINFNSGKINIDEYPSSHYIDLLNLLKSRYQDQYWHILPREMSQFWAKNVCSNKNDSRMMNIS